MKMDIIKWDESMVARCFAACWDHEVAAAAEAPVPVSAGVSSGISYSGVQSQKDKEWNDFEKALRRVMRT
jgi:hypothetical protein